MSDVGNITGTYGAVAQQQVATTVLGLANETSRPAQQLLEQATKTAGPSEEGKGAQFDEQA